jgi:hypothetical protein
LTKDFKPLTDDEIETEARNYADFCHKYTLENAARNKLSYVIVDSNYFANLTNLDRWYERDEGEQIGKFVLYRVKLKQNE